MPATVFEEIGGEPAIRALVARFYDIVEAEPEGRALLELHFQGHGLAHVRAEQLDFLQGFLGGPRLYAERHGHMNLRALHAHVPIRPSDAGAWLAVMARALDDAGIRGPARARMEAAFERAAQVLVNRREDGGPLDPAADPGH